MHFYRALAKGRLSEILGPEALTIDKHMRTIGLPYRADEHLKVISTDELDNLVHYSSGVNEAIK